MGYALVSYLRQSVFPFGVASTLVTVFAVSSELGPAIGVRGLYAVFGLLLGAAVYYGLREKAATARANSNRLRWATKGVCLITILAAGTAAAIDRRLFVLILTLPIGYGLFLIQLRADRSPRVLLPQALALFSVPPVTKYVTTGFYFGGGDLIFHVYNIRRVLATGTTSAIRVHDVYQQFPGLHFLAGSTSLIAGLTPYDGLMTTGLLTYVAVALPLLYILSRILFNKQLLGVHIVLAASMLYPLGYHATYFFPQSLAVVLLLAALFAIYRAGDLARTTHHVWVGTCLFFITSVMFVHHLTFILFIPIIVTLAAVPILSNIVSRADNSLRVARLRMVPFVAGLIAAVTYWTLTAKSYIYGQAVWFKKIVAGLIFASSQSTTTTAGVVAYGRLIPEPTVPQALAEFSSVGTLYLLVLTAVFALGITAFLDRFREWERALPFVILGSLSAPLIFKTPLLIPGLSRIRLPFAFFFALPVGFGLFKLTRSSHDRSLTRVLPVIIFLALAVTAPLYIQTSRDVTSLHETDSSPPLKQVSFSEEEVSALRAASEFTVSSDSTIETLWIDKLALEANGVESVEPATYDSSGISADSGLLLYRTTWPRHTVFAERPSWVKIIIGEQWLQRNVARSNKVYSSGSAAMLWDDGTVRLKDPQ